MMSGEATDVPTRGAVRQYSPKHLDFPGMSQAVLAGDFLMISGQVALGEDASLVGDGDPFAQAEQCFANLRTVLEAAGMTIHNVVQYTCYLTRADHYDAFSAVKHRYFGESRPAATSVIVASLLDPRMYFELEAVAIREELSDRRR